MAILGPATGARSEVRVNIGISLPGPPALVTIPASPVVYAPSVGANYFFYGGRYYVFHNEAWYVSGGFNGPWVVVAPEFVPRPLLAVPVRYYRVPPPHWRHWHHEQPPRWSQHWGHRWEERAEGREERREERWEDRREHRRERR
jgi:hypothetical protein